MSHFTVGAIIPKSRGKSAGDIELYLAEALARYDEKREVEEHEVDCSCGRWKGESMAEAEVERQLGPIETAREKFAEENGSKTAKERDELWLKAVVQERIDMKAKVLEDHPDWGKPDPECTDCGGTGKRMTTYNPESKWDWWVVGGRWNGQIKGAPRGDGKGGFNFEPEFHGLEDNLAMGAGCLAQNYIPYAIITPEGEWKQKGQMGWWGISTHETEKWGEEAKAIFEAHKDFIVVSLDCHI